MGDDPAIPRPVADACYLHSRTSTDGRIARVLNAL